MFKFCAGSAKTHANFLHVQGTSSHFVHVIHTVCSLVPPQLEAQPLLLHRGIHLHTLHTLTNSKHTCMRDPRAMFMQKHAALKIHARVGRAMDPGSTGCTATYGGPPRRALTPLAGHMALFEHHGRNPAHEQDRLQ